MTCELSKLKQYVTDLPICIDQLNLRLCSAENVLTNESWLKLIEKCLLRNRDLILLKKPHKSLPAVKDFESIVEDLVIYSETFYSKHEAVTELIEMYNQLYQIICLRLFDTNIDPKKIRGMYMEQPNNFYVLFV
jgi:hypothetical protein